MRKASPPIIVSDPEPDGIGVGSPGITEGWSVAASPELQNGLLWAGSIPDRNALSLTNHDSGAARVGLHVQKTRERNGASRFTSNNNVGLR